MSTTATLTAAQADALAAAKDGELVRRIGARYTARGVRVLPSTAERLYLLGLITWKQTSEHEWKAEAA